MHLLNHRITGRSLVLIISETALIVSAITIAAYVRLGEFAWDIALHENGIAKALLIAAVTQTCLYYADLYDLRLLGDRRELFTRLPPGAGSGVIHSRGTVFLVPRPRDRSRCVPDRRCPGRDVCHRLAHRV
jgi:hypothetical protein